MNLEDKCKIFIIYEYIIDRPNYPGNSIKILSIIPLLPIYALVCK